MPTHKWRPKVRKGREGFKNIREAQLYIQDKGLTNAGIYAGNDERGEKLYDYPLDEVVVTAKRPYTAPTPWLYSSAFDGSYSNLYDTLDAMSGGFIGMTPILGDVLDAGKVGSDLSNKKYGEAAIGAGLLALPNFIEKPAKLVKNGVRWLKDESWLLKNLKNNILGLTNPYLWDRIKSLSRNPTLVRDFSNYTDNSYHADLSTMKEALPLLKKLYQDFPGLGKISNPTGIEHNPALFLSDAREMANRAKHYAGGYLKLMSKLKSENTTLYNIAKESPQYALQIYNDLVNGRVKNTENYVKSLVDQSNTFMRGMRGIDPQTNPDAYLTIGGGLSNKYTMDVGSPNVVLDERMRYGTPVIYKPKNRKLTGNVDTWWDLRVPKFLDQSIAIRYTGMHTGDGIFNLTQLIPNYRTNQASYDLGKMLMPYIKQLDIPASYGRNAGHMIFESPNKGASIADLFDVIPASDVDLNNIKFGLGYKHGGKL